MDLPALSEIIPVVVVVGIAACIYMVAGFGFALFAVPSISLFMPVKDSVALIALLGLTSVVRQSLALRTHVDRPSATRFSMFAVLGMPFGFWIVTAISDQALRVFLGVSTIIATLVLLRRTENHRSHRSIENGFAFISGVLNTSIGTNGSPLVFALQGRRLTPDQFRGTIAVIFCGKRNRDHRNFRIRWKVHSATAPARVLCVANLDCWHIDGRQSCNTHRSTTVPNGGVMPSWHHRFDNATVGAVSI